MMYDLESSQNSCLRFCHLIVSPLYIVYGPYNLDFALEVNHL